MATPLMIFANGYPRPYTSDRAEIGSATAKPPTWFPASVDFQRIRTAKHTVDGGREASLEIVRPVSASGSKLWV